MIDETRPAVFVRSIDGERLHPLSSILSRGPGRGRILRAALLSLVALTGACDRTPPPPSPEDVLAARQSALRLDQELHVMALRSLENGTDARQVLTAYLTVIEGTHSMPAAGRRIDVGRTALRVRNPANAADDWERDKLEIFRFAMEGGVDPATLEISEIVDEATGQRVFRWIKPVAMEETCLTCHGDRIDPPLLDQIEELYPADEATGYYSLEMGGAYSVRIPLN